MTELLGRSYSSGKCSFFGIGFPLRKTGKAKRVGLASDALFGNLGLMSLVLRLFRYAGQLYFGAMPYGPVKLEQGYL